MPKMIRIAHPDGREGAIEPRDFTVKKHHPDGRSYAEQGWVMDSQYEDGSPYDGPTSQREIDKAATERQAAREAPKAADKDAPKGSKD